MLASRGPLPQLLAQKKQLLNDLEKLEAARKRSSKTAYNASQYEERITKQFFSQFKSGLANADISSLYTITDWDSPDDRGRVTQNNNEIVEEFAHYYAHLARPKPSHNPETLLDALSKKGLSERQRNTLEAPLELEEIEILIVTLAHAGGVGAGTGDVAATTATE
eukprot:scaffold13235_cov118-Isochrysis_galbana.AAC.3